MHRKRSTLGTRKNIKPPVPVQQASTCKRRLGSGQRQRPERLNLAVAKRRLQWPTDSTQKNKNESFGHQKKQIDPFQKKPTQVRTIAKSKGTINPVYKFGYVSNNSRELCGTKSYQPRNVSLLSDRTNITCSPRQDISEGPALIESSSSQQMDFNKWRRVTSKDFANQNSAEIFRNMCSSSDLEGIESIATPVLLQSTYSQNKFSCLNSAGESTALRKSYTSSAYRKMGSINSPFLLNSKRSQRLKSFLPQNTKDFVEYSTLPSQCDDGDFTDTIKLRRYTKSEIPIKTYKFTDGETENKDAHSVFTFGKVAGLEDLSSAGAAEIFSRNLNNAVSLKVTTVPAFNETPSSMKLRSEATELSNKTDSLHNSIYVNTPVFNKTPNSMKLRSKCTELSNKTDSLHNSVRVNTPSFNKTPSSMELRSNKYTHGNTIVPKQCNYVSQTPLRQKRNGVNDAVPELSHSVGIKIKDAPLLFTSGKTHKFKSCTNMKEFGKSEININNEQSDTSVESDETYTERPRWPSTLEKFTDFWNPVSSLSQTAHYKRKEIGECSMKTSPKPDDKETKKKERSKCTISNPQSNVISPKLKKCKLQYGSPDRTKSDKDLNTSVECWRSLKSCSNVSEMHIVTSPFPSVEPSNHLNESMEMDICQVACTSLSNTNTVSTAVQTELTVIDMDDVICMKTTLGNVLAQFVQQKEHMNSLLEQQEEFKIQQEQFKIQQEQFKIQQEQFNTQQEQFETICRKRKVELQDFQQRSNAIESEIKKIVSILNKKEIDDGRSEDTLKEDNNFVSGVTLNSNEKSGKCLKRSISRTPLRRSARIAANSSGAVSAGSSHATSITVTPENLMSDKENCFSGSESLPLSSTTSKALDKSMKLYTELRSNFTFLKTPKTEKKLCKEVSCAKTPSGTPRRVLSQRIHNQLLSLYE